MSLGYDAIMGGARCAGLPTAMLLARKGYRVRRLDRATFPSDTMSTTSTRPASQPWSDGACSSGSGRPAARRLSTYSFDFGPSRSRAPAWDTARLLPRRIDAVTALIDCPRGGLLAEVTERRALRTARGAGTVLTVVGWGGTIVACLAYV